MRWTVEGADQHSGQERVITVEADTKAQAERIARGRGLLVSDVHPPVNLTDAEKLEAMVGRAVAAQQETPDTSNPPVVEYATPAVTSPSQSMPDYPGIIKGADLLQRSANTMEFLAWIVGAM